MTTPNKTLAFYAAEIKRKKCRWCETNLPSRIDHYNHSGGWLVAGFESPQWLYVTCVGCGYQWSLWKLGVSRDQETAELPITFDDFMRESKDSSEDA